MKLRIIRYSGKPVSMEHLAEFEAEYKQRYDEILAAHSPDMLKVHEELIKLDEELGTKWSTIQSEPVPKSAKAWGKLIDSYDCPIMIARNSDNPKEIVMVLMDMPGAAT